MEKKAGIMRDMTNFTIRYDVIGDTTINSINHNNETYKNFKYFPCLDSKYDSSNPCNITIEELLTLLLQEIEDRDNIIKEYQNKVGDQH